MSILGQPIGHESHLERDLLMILRFDRTLAAVREQPFTIPCHTTEGRQTRYTPDFVTVHTGPPPSGYIIEVKETEDLKKNWRTLSPRLKAGRRFAHERGLRFLLLTERQIRGSHLDACRFLNGYIHLPRDESIEEHLVHQLAGLGPSTADHLLDATFPTARNRDTALAYVWKLVATGRIEAITDEGPLDRAKTPLWIDADSDWCRYNPYSRKHMLKMGDDAWTTEANSST